MSGEQRIGLSPKQCPVFVAAWCIVAVNSITDRVYISIYNGLLSSLPDNSPDMGDKEHHVHFSGGSGMGRDSNIMIQPQRHGHIDAHLGFLQLHHRYHIEFSIPWNVCVHGEGQSIAPAVVVANSNPNCSVIEFAQDKDGLRLKVDLLAYKEIIMKEEVQLLCCKAGTPLNILIHARVLGKDKGTPLLRNGIKSVGIEVNGDENDDDEDDDENDDEVSE